MRNPFESLDLTPSPLPEKSGTRNKKPEITKEREELSEEGSGMISMLALKRMRRAKIASEKTPFTGGVSAYPSTTSFAGYESTAKPKEKPEIFRINDQTIEDPSNE